VIRSDGKQIAQLSIDKINLYPGDVVQKIMQGDQAIESPDLALVGHSEPILAAAYSPDGQLLATTALRYQRVGDNVLDDILHPGDKYEVRFNLC